MRRLFVCVLLIVLALAACNSLDSTPASSPTSTPQTTSIVTESSRGFATVTATVNVLPIVPDAPVSVEERACANAPRTRLIVGERGQVRDEDPRPLNVRSGPGTEFRILGRLEILDIFSVLDGPMCGGDFAWFLVERGNLQGWIAEGDFSSYYTEPYLPG
jgi:hypothetical protein